MGAKRTLKTDIRKYGNIYGNRQEIEKIVDANLKLPFAAVLGKWNEPGRYYHDLSHLDNLIGQIYELNDAGRVPLVLLALMHDVIYNPRSADNEDASREFFDRHVKPGCSFKEVVGEGIEHTKYQGLKKPKSEIIRTFLLMDLKGLFTGDMKRLLADEKRYSGNTNGSTMRSTAIQGRTSWSTRLKITAGFCLRGSRQQAWSGCGHSQITCAPEGLM